MAEMIARERLAERQGFTVADLWRMTQLPEYADRHFELMEGEIIKMALVGEWHGFGTTRIARLLDEYVESTSAGIVTTETGYYHGDDDETLLAPDVAFRRTILPADPDSNRFVPVMPSLVAEIKSPRDTYAHMRHKAELYLQRGTQIVWLVYPERRGVDVCTLGEAGALQTEFVAENGSLSGGDALPGFALELSRLFT